MSKKLMSLTLSALDDWYKLKNLQLLLEMAIDQLEGNDKLTLKLELLITCYLTSAELQLDELHAGLEKMRRQLRDKND